MSWRGNPVPTQSKVDKKRKKGKREKGKKEKEGKREKVSWRSNPVPTQSDVEPLLLFIITHPTANIKSNPLLGFFFFIILCFVVTFQCCHLTAILTKYWIVQIFLSLHQRQPQRMRLLCEMLQYVKQ